MSTAKVRVCKDCLADAHKQRLGDFDAVVPKRSAPHPGPRCATHHRAKRKDRAEKTHERHVVATYAGLGPGGYAKLLDAQRGLCAGCGPITGRNGKTKRLTVDHDHRTGEVRGLLCGGGAPMGGGSGCNRIIGLVHDNPEILERLAAYLRNPPARAVLGGGDRNE